MLEDIWVRQRSDQKNPNQKYLRQKGFHTCNTIQIFDVMAIVFSPSTLSKNSTSNLPFNVK